MYVAGRVRSVDCRVFRSGGMVQVSQRKGFTDSALVRLLAPLADIEVHEPEQAFADRLSQWLDWTAAVSMAAALNGKAAPALSGARASVNAEEIECTRVRSALLKGIAEDDAATHRSDTVPGFTPYRRRYAARQRAMETGIGPLRVRLRAALAARSPAMARLADVDAVMEQSLGAREHSLLSSVPVLLEKHFVRLRQADAAAPSGRWLDVFRKDLHGVLLAELDFRLRPVEGLLEALRAR